MGKSSKGARARKSEKSRQFHAKVRDTFTSLAAKKEIEKKQKRKRRRNNLKAYDLSTLSECLPDIEALKKSRRAQGGKLTWKRRQELLLREQQRMSILLKDPDFQADPIAAIQRHLESTQPPLEERPQTKTKKNGSQKAKRKKKASSGPQSMDL